MIQLQMVIVKEITEWTKKALRFINANNLQSNNFRLCCCRFPKEKTSVISDWKKYK
jgi:hypothetical protein